MGLAEGQRFTACYTGQSHLFGQLQGQHKWESTSSSHCKIQLSQGLQTTADKHLHTPPTHCAPPHPGPDLLYDFLPQQMKILPFLAAHPPSAEELRLQECIDAGLYVKAVYNRGGCSVLIYISQ